MDNPTLDAMFIGGRLGRATGSMLRGRRTAGIWLGDIVAGVFINYRTDDGEWAASLLDDVLTDRFGPDQVFYASRSIPAGKDFSREITRRLHNSDILLALIGKRWLERDATGRRKIDDPDDWVRREIRTAFEHDIHVIPVLLDNAPLVPKEGMPDDIAGLAKCQFMHLRHSHGRDDDVNALVNELAHVLPLSEVELWQVCVRDSRGAVRGAGVLLSDEYVLTADQVLANGGDEVTVEFVGLDGTSRTRARAAPDLRAPVVDGCRGGVAMLRLSHRLSTRVGAILHRRALSWESAVHLRGYSPAAEDGLRLRGVLRGPDGARGEWLRVSADSQDEHRLQAGYAGAGVVDDRTGHVLGIVVAVHTEGQAWMIPVETIAGHLSIVNRWVTGDSLADKSFSRPVRPGAAVDKVLRRVIGWTARRDSGDCVLIVVGPDVEGLHRAVTWSDRQRATGSDTRPAPAPGTIDLAVDASGRTVDDVARRILDRAGILPQTTRRSGEQVLNGVPPMTIVVDGVDGADQPEALLDDLLYPLADGGSRLVLGFHATSSPALDRARSWDLGSAEQRLARLAESINEVDVVEQRLTTLRARVRDPEPSPSYDTASLQLALGALRGMAGSPDQETLDRCERKVAQARRKVNRTESRLWDLVRERDTLRGSLDAYRTKANDEGLVEDMVVAKGYRTASELLWHAPTDLPSARRAFQDYLIAIRQAAAGK